MDERKNEEQLLRLRAVLKRFPISKARWYLGVSRGEFPKPIRLTERTVAWKSSDIDRLIEQTTEASR